MIAFYCSCSDGHVNSHIPIELQQGRRERYAFKISYLDESQVEVGEAREAHYYIHTGLRMAKALKLFPK